MPDQVQDFDVVIIGGGIAGASLGAELAEDHSVAVLEAETTLAKHTTGRSAATFIETMSEGPQVRALTAASREFLQDPPGYVHSRLLNPMGLLVVAPAGSAAEQLRADFSAVAALVEDARLVGPDEAIEINPILAPGRTELAMHEPRAADLDVDALHQGYVRAVKQCGGSVITGVRLTSAERAGRTWTMTDAEGNRFRAPMVINAAGAWVDCVAALFGARPVGIRPLRRSIFVIPAPEALDIKRIPMTMSVNGGFYLKPEARQILCSPAEEVPDVPGDARPDMLDVARALEAINETTTLNARTVRNQWAGLRSFAPDRLPVVGFDATVDGLFWYGGQGGYGIQTAPALARLAAAVARSRDVPGDLARHGLTATMFAPDRAFIPVAQAH